MRVPQTSYHSPWDTTGSETPAPELTDMPKPRHSRWRGFATLLFVVFLAGAAYYSFLPASPGPAITVDIVDPGAVLVGEPFTLAVAVSNLSDETLANGRLSILLPDDLYVRNKPREERYAETIVGDVGPGSVHQESFSVVAGGAPESVRRIEARFAYTLAKNPKAQFEQRSEADLRIGEAAVLLDFETPAKVFSGEDFDVSVTYRNNAKEPLRDVRLTLAYPPLFQFVTSTMARAGTSTNVWNLGTLDPGVAGQFTLTGSTLGAAASSLVITGVLEADAAKAPYEIASQSANVSIAPSPLSIAVAVNGGNGYAAGLNDALRYEFRYRNESSVALRDVVVNVKLTGELFDFSSARTNAVFDSVQNVFTWSGASVPELQNVPPGRIGTLILDIVTAKSFPIRRASDKNFTLHLEAEAFSPTVPPGTEASRTYTRTALTTPVRGVVTLDAKGLWRDAASKVVNRGPYPPRANQTTQYSIHWIVKTVGADFENVRVSGKLASGSRFVRAVLPNGGAEPTWNAATGVVTWEVGAAAANRGFGGNALEAVFQIEQTPAVNQVGSDLTLMDEIALSAEDVFVELPASEVSENITTALPDDPTITAGDRRVQP